MPNINRLLKQYQNIIISIVIIVFCIVGVVAAVVPSVQKIQGLYDEMSSLADQSKMLHDKLSTLSALDENQLRQQLSVLVSAVPSDKSLPTVFSTVEGVAGQAGVSIAGMNIGGDTSLATASATTKQTSQERLIGTRTIPFSVTIDGSLSAVQQFITLAPGVRRLLRIRTFAITFPQGDKQLNIALDMDAFYQPMPTNIGKTNAVLPKMTAEEQGVISKVSQLPLASSDDVSLPPPLIGQMKQDPFSP